LLLEGRRQRAKEREIRETRKTWEKIIDASYYILYT
jgi:hypothetical protein